MILRAAGKRQLSCPSTVAAFVSSRTATTVQVAALSGTLLHGVWHQHQNFLFVPAGTAE
jgi:hypothetical protein